MNTPVFKVIKSVKCDSEFIVRSIPLQEEKKKKVHNSHKNSSVFLQSRKRPAPVMETFFASPGSPLKRASTLWIDFQYHVISTCVRAYVRKISVRK